jgi:hypothetical protein
VRSSVKVSRNAAAMQAMGEEREYLSMRRKRAQ